MLAGCFTETAFGLFDSDHDGVIFNGTDEGLPVIPYTAHQVLAPWPKAMDLISLQPVSTGGALIGLYKNPLAVFKSQRDPLGRITAKELTAPPDLTLKDALGRPLVVNPQTLAFSDGGSWLVAETFGRSFVRINLATLSVIAFSPAYGSPGGPPGPWQSRVAISEDGRFAAIANDNAGEFKVFDLATCDGKIDGLLPQDCKSYDYHPFVRQHINSLRAIGHVRFVNERLLSFGAWSTDHSGDGEYELSPAVSITSLTDYIGLGDSYTSGEGAFDYLTGTDGPDNMCHLSRRSYPLLLGQDLFGAAGGHSVACSGAVIKDIGNTSGDYRGQARGGSSLQQLQQSEPWLLESVEAGFIPGYVAQHRFVKRWQPQIVTVSIGGNDIGFGDIVQKCVEPHISRHPNGNTCYNTYEDRLELANLIDRTIPRWTALYRQLQRETPGTWLYAIGYPQIAVDNGNCGLNVQLNKSELKFAEETVDYLNQDIKKSAAEAGVTYVDISQALKGHRLCEAAGYDIAVNGLTAGGDAGPFGVGVLGRESYHPNGLGHELIEQAILRQTHNLSAPAPPLGADNNDNAHTPDAPALLDAPKTGRTVYTFVPDDHLAPSLAKRGLAVPVGVDGSLDGLQPGATYNLRLDGPSGAVLGSITSDSAGNAGGSITIPENTLPGGHTIDIIGESENGEPADVSQLLYVPASDSDIDGDGIDNATDSCPGAVNSGQDSDRDGIDDVCDGLMAPPAGPGSTDNHKGPGVKGRHGVVAAAVSKLRIANVLGAATYNPEVFRRAGPRHGAGASAHLKHSVPEAVFPWLFWLVAAVIPGLILALAIKFNKKVRFHLQ